VTTAPVASTERMDVLDVIRGVAVFGILLVNIYAFSGYGFISEVQKRALPGARFDPLMDELIFYGIGLEMFGRLSLTTVVAGSAAFFVLQMIASRLWLSIALFGPAEWLWRTFTYGRRFPLLR
jgi:uncharacterized membrane protein YeiB